MGNSDKNTDSKARRKRRENSDGRFQKLLTYNRELRREAETLRTRVTELELQLRDAQGKLASTRAAEIHPAWRED
jgi:hypothetical protein